MIEQRFLVIAVEAFVEECVDFGPIVAGALRDYAKAIEENRTGRTAVQDIEFGPQRPGDHWGATVRVLHVSGWKRDD
jgi:hypothetical protein